MKKEPGPSDLEVSAQSSRLGMSSWTLTIGDSAPYDAGNVEGTRDDALRAGAEARLGVDIEGAAPDDSQAP
jgi:hypothetical protein